MLGISTNTGKGDRTDADEVVDDTANKLPLSNSN